MKLFVVYNLENYTGSIMADYLFIHRENAEKKLVIENKKAKTNPSLYGDEKIFKIMETETED